MKSTACKNWFGGETADDVGTYLGGKLTIHDITTHQGAECKDARIEIAAFILHCMKIEPREIEAVVDRMREHLKICHCGGGRQFHT